jgi:hypothetical protein
MNKKTEIINFENKTAWIIGFSLFIYLILRSVYSPILHDEIATFYHFVQSGIYFPPEAQWDANNHILNSLLTEWSYKLFGSSPWALRLPNVLSFPLFFWSVWKLAKLIRHNMLRWGFLFALTMAHYMFEYFGETRGYGMSMAFLLWGIYLVLLYIQYERFYFLIGVVFALLLATTANLTLVYSILLIGALLTFNIFTRRAITQRKLLHLLCLFCGLVFLIPLIQYALDLKAHGALYYGGKSGFWKYTGGTLAYLYFGYYSKLIAIIISILFVFIFGSYLLVLKTTKQSFRVVVLEPVFIWVFLLLGSLIAIFCTRYLLDVNFPEDRAAMYLFPYFIGSLVFVVDKLNFQKSNWLKVFVGLVLFFFPIQFVLKMNLNTASFSMEERAPQEFYTTIKNTPRTDKYPLSVGGYVTQLLCWNYMNYQDGGNEGRMLTSNHIDTLSDFQIVNINKKLNLSFLASYDKINREPINELNLFKRKYSLQKQLIVQRDSITNWNHNHDEYFGFLEYVIPDSLIGKPLFIGLEATIHSPVKPFIGSVVVSQKTATYQELQQETIKLDWIKNEWDNSPNNFIQGLVIPEIYTGTKHLIVYLWNQKEASFLVYNGTCEVFSLK